MEFEFIRGDTKKLKFQIKDKNGTILKLDPDRDRLYFTLKAHSNSKKILLQKKFPQNIIFKDDYYYITLLPEDTSDLSYGTYNYDIEIVSGTITKTLLLGTITLTDEITWKGDEN